MSFEDSIEALKNLTTGKYFILLEDGVIPGRVKAINPEGHIINVAEKLFDPDFERVAKEEFPKYFSDAQLQTLSMYNDESAARMERELELAHAPADDENGAKERPRRPLSKASKAYDPRSPQSAGRVAAQWTSPQLTFYRHKIEPLRPSDRFCVTVEDEGDFVITKMEFLKVFNNVVMDPIYRSQGIFRFPAIPDSAQPFMQRR